MGNNKKILIDTLNSIDENLLVEMKANDLAFIYKTIEKLIVFFHQPNHYPSINEVKEFIGNKDEGAYSLLSYIYYNILERDIPEDVKSILEG